MRDNRRTPTPILSRRRFLSVAAAASAACAANTQAVSPDAAMGRLRARPRRSASTTGPGAGEQSLGLGRGRDGLLFVPRELPPRPPLVVLLHGATGSAQGILRRLSGSGLPERFHAIVLATDSRQRTWDAIGGEFGPDVAFLDEALAWTFDRFAVDPTRVAIGGFSDGASYAISLGLINGDLFTHVMAFSPGFFVPGEPHGKPDIFVSHGKEDEILPIDRTSRRLVPRLRDLGYPVDYHEFDGPHTVPAAMAEAAFERLAGRK
jgi:phospholipase/carboxylesterase